MLLPFVLQSAEVMKRSVDYLAPFMEKAEREEGRRILLATVAGDVHDIGKNLVDIILSNNGYRVVNLGIKVPAETIIEKARELRVDVIGLSGLLVKSALVMQENLPQFAAAGLRVPVLLGRGGPHGEVRGAGVRPRVPRAGGLLRRRVRGPVGHAPDRRGDAFVDGLRRGRNRPRHDPRPQGGRRRPGQPRARAALPRAPATSTGSTRGNCSPTSTSRPSSAAGGGTGGGR